MKNIEPAKDTFIERSCPLCGGDEALILSDRMQFDLNLTTVICKKCSFVFTNPIPSPQSIDSFYRTDYSKYYGNIASRPDGDHRKYMPVVIKRRINHIEKFSPISGRQLLEIGPGNGLFMWWLHEAGCNVVGIEPSEEFCSRIQQEGLPCIHDSIENINPDTLPRSNIVVMLHVLEHFRDPNLVLQKCRELLTDDGLLVVEVPNILKPYRSLDRYFLRYVHLSYFSPQTLTSMLVKNGYSVIFLDEGDNGLLNPENLFVMAQKSDHCGQDTQETMPDAGELLLYLRRYRMRWMVIRAPAWYMMTGFYKLRRYAYKTASRLKRKFTMPGDRS